MTIYFSFTISIDKENYNEEVNKFVLTQNRNFDYYESKDGFTYSLEFNSNKKEDEFKILLQKNFPFLF